jgi:hypothetical protein
MEPQSSILSYQEPKWALRLLSHLSSVHSHTLFISDQSEYCPPICVQIFFSGLLPYTVSIVRHTTET